MEHSKHSHHNIIAYSDENTVLAEYIPPKEKPNTHFESEAELENLFIQQLIEQKYERLHITKEDELKRNLRHQIEKLNNIKFSEDEWTRFFREKIAPPNKDIIEKTAFLHHDHAICDFIRDDKSTKNIKLIDRENIHNNHLQVINQYEPEGGSSRNRYDVTILVNGLPMIHCELKRRSANLREAFDQIDRYNRQSFWADSGLFQYIQIFIISNGTFTKYYANTVRKSHTDGINKRKNKSKRGFSFTSFWADGKNRPINDISDFTRTFLVKRTILNILTKYCIFDTEHNLKVMRPYQIFAAERIIERIRISLNDSKRLAKPEGGGYIWHTTGSGKTLTSFKTAQLAYQIDEIEKVFFVVDRKDLDSQTVKEYDKFKKGSVDNTSSTAKLKENIESNANKIIVTTIQKLSRFLDKNKTHDIYEKHIVLIFDECHRSQFGDMHRAITKKFKKYNLFGFTGTPIFVENAPKNVHPNFKTTEQIFGDQLHSYTIVDAINDMNVLPFRVEYVNTIKLKEKEIADKEVSGIDTQKVLRHPERIKVVTQYIIEHFKAKTKDFNSLLATDSIEAAKIYYKSFKEQQAEKPENERLKVGIIYSSAANPNAEEIENNYEIDENSASANELPLDDRDFLKEAINDYNKIYSSNFDIVEGFENYYRDLSTKLKEKKIDIVIVVNMFLTGFDAPTLNTLWVDKSLKYHSLIQAYSRTNRILDTTKVFGNIVCFRNLEEATNEALMLFSNDNTNKIVLTEPYHESYGKYQEVVKELHEKFPIPLDANAILRNGETVKKDFVELFNKILRLRNYLLVFDEFKEILPDRDLQNYQSVYLEIREQTREADKANKEDITGDLVYETELMQAVDINVDYIINLIANYAQNDKNSEIKEEITRTIGASDRFRNIKDLIEAFMITVSLQGDTHDQWKNFMKARKDEEIEKLIKEENLKEKETLKYIENAFETEIIREDGSALPSLIQGVSLFSSGDKYKRKKELVYSKISQIFERFRGIF